MKAYRRATNLKLGLIVFAVLIAVTSLAYTNELVERLRERESQGIEIWAEAREQAAAGELGNPYTAELLRLQDILENEPREIDDPEGLVEAVNWALGMPNDEHMGFFYDILREYFVDVPAIMTDSVHRPIAWRNIALSDTIQPTAHDSLRIAGYLKKMADTFDPIPVETQYGSGQGSLKQYVYYDESSLVRELRIYPYVQLFFVALFIALGYLGFSYVRKNEQSSLWVGMAREAAHQLGTPISSLMGWLELMRREDTDRAGQQEALDEMVKDVDRLSRVTNRFNDIGSMPKLTELPLATVINPTAEFIRRRFPRNGVTLGVVVSRDLVAPLNAQLFAWVIENLLKNALDAIEGTQGHIQITASQVADRISIDIVDTGKGVERRQWKNIFRPGFSTKRRGWGLGLSLAKRIVEDYHGGSLTVATSRLGRGTTMRIELPAA